MIFFQVEAAGLFQPHALLLSQLPPRPRFSAPYFRAIGHIHVTKCQDCADNRADRPAGYRRPFGCDRLLRTDTDG